MKPLISNVKVDKVYQDDFERVYNLLLDFQAPYITKEQWQRLFTSPWGSFEDYRGYKLTYGDKVVGFLGTIFSKRYLNGQEYKFCNLTSWIVKPEYRAKSISLLWPILQLKDYTITNLTSEFTLYNLFKKFGFKDLGLYRYIFPPLPPVNVIGRGRKCHIINDQNVIEKLLNENDLRIFRDHMDYGCIHLIIERNLNYCYIVATRVLRRGLPYIYIHYINNINIFSENIFKIILRILIKYKSVGIIIDERLLKGHKISLALKNKVTSYKIYKSLSLHPEDIDNLYTEIILLNL